MSKWKIFQSRIHGFLEYKELLSQLVIRDVKLKYRRSILGYVWSVLNPLLVMLVMTLVFSTMFSRDVENFPVYMLTGSILNGFMNEATNNAMRSITGNSALLKKAYVPKYIFPLSKVTSSLVNLLFSLGALILVMLFTGVSFKLTNILFFVPILQLYVFCIGLGILLSQMAVFFKDIEYIYSVVTTAWFYLTPIFYPVEVLSGKIHWLVTNLNPMYFYITQFRQVMLYGELMSFSLIIKGTLIALSLVVISLWCFLKSQDKFILYI